MSFPHRASIIHQIERLAAPQQKLVFDFVRLLATANAGKPKGISGKDLLSYAGIIPLDDLEAMSKLIEQDCEQVNLNEW